MREGIPSDFLREVKARSDIVTVLSGYLDLKKAGKNYVALCPFHPDRRPSLSVSPERQMFYCFACGAGGDVVTFLMKREGLSFIESVRLLARKAGLTWPEVQVTPAQEARARLRRRLLEALAVARRFFRQQLESEAGRVAREYLRQRGVDEETAARFELGYAPDSWDALGRHLQKEGFGEEELVKAGLSVPRESGKGCYDRFRHRLMFPIWDLQGQVIAFGGRALSDGHPKYLNSPESLCFQKGSVWYGLHLARDAVRRKGHALVMEGYMDVLTAHQFGFDWAVASMGTALTREQGRLLQGFCGEALVCYDADAAGQAATARSLDIFRELGLKVRVVELPEGQDPDSCLRSQGGDGFARLLKEALPLVEYRLEAELRKAGDREGKLQTVANIIAVLSDISNAVEREEYLRLVATRLSVPEEALREELKKYGRRSRQRHKGGPGREPITEMMESGSRLAVPRAEEMLVRFMLQDSGKVDRVMARVTAEDFPHQPWRKIAEALVSAARALSQRPEEENVSWGELVAEYVADEEYLGVLARLQIEEQDDVDPERQLQDCLAVLEEERDRRLLQERTAMVRLFEQSGRAVPATLLEECQELTRRIKIRKAGRLCVGLGKEGTAK